MAGQHDLHNHQISVKYPQATWRRIEIDAAAHGMKPGEYIRWVTSERVANIPLSADDAQIVADRIRQAEALGKMV